MIAEQARTRATRAKPSDFALAPLLLVNRRPLIAKCAMSGPLAIDSGNKHQLTGIWVTVLLPPFATQMLLPSKATPSGSDPMV